MLAQEVIRHKRDGKKLTKEEIDFFIRGITDWSVSECQIAAWTMAVFLRGMEDDETVALTRAMTASGQTMAWADKNLNGPVVDKHSTGGVGDKVSLMLAPMLAACGAYVPMISGRGLGHTGGTLDKLDSIPGYSTVPEIDTFYKVTKDVGCAIVGQTGDLAPADKRIYAVRDVTATVESIPLITASILSKKLAAGLEALVMDLKCGNGAFMAGMDNARKLAKMIVAVAKGAGMPAHAVLTDMNQVLGYAAGNAVEVAEAVAYLKGVRREPRLHEITTALCSEALILKGLAADRDDARAKLQTVLDNGKAAELFGKMVAGLGGPTDFVENPDKYLPKAPIVRPVFAEKEGYVAEVDTREIGLSIILLGGQRKTPGQKLDYSVGYTDFIHIGEKADKQTPLAVIHAKDEDTFAQAATVLKAKIKTADKMPEISPVIYETVTE